LGESYVISDVLCKFDVAMVLSGGHFRNFGVTTKEMQLAHAPLPIQQRSNNFGKKHSLLKGSSLVQNRAHSAASHKRR
jgi:hypothetical protein